MATSPERYKTRNLNKHYHTESLELFLNFLNIQLPTNILKRKAIMNIQLLFKKTATEETQLQYTRANNCRFNVIPIDKTAAKKHRRSKATNP